MTSLPLRFSSSSWRAYLKGSLKKFFLSISFCFLCLLIRSARRSLASLCLRSFHNSLRPSFSSGTAFLHLFLRWRLSDMSNSMCLSLHPFCLGAMVCLDAHSPTSLCTPRIWCFPSKLACTQPFLAKNAAALHWGIHRACTKPLAYSPLATWSCCTFLDAFVEFLVVWLVRGQCASRSRGLPPSFAEVALSALSGPAALWFATRLWVPSVWPMYIYTYTYIQAHLNKLECRGKVHLFQ